MKHVFICKKCKCSITIYTDTTSEAKPDKCFKCGSTAFVKKQKSEQDNEVK